MFKIYFDVIYCSVLIVNVYWVIGGFDWVISFVDFEFILLFGFYIWQCVDVVVQVFSVEVVL